MVSPRLWFWIAGFAGGGEADEAVARARGRVWGVDRLYLQAPHVIYWPGIYTHHRGRRLPERMVLSKQRPAPGRGGGRARVDRAAT